MPKTTATKLARPSPPHRARVGVLRLGVALGLTWVIGLVALMVMMHAGWGGTRFFKLIEDSYIGCRYKTWSGRAVCLAFGFVDGFVGGILIAWLYNVLP